MIGITLFCKTLLFSAFGSSIFNSYPCLLGLSITYSNFLVLNADNAPAAIVGLVGSREYDKCAKDLYYFLQVIIVLKGASCILLSGFFYRVVTASFLL